MHGAELSLASVPLDGNTLTGRIVASGHKADERRTIRHPFAFGFAPLPQPRLLLNPVVTHRYSVLSMKSGWPGRRGSKMNLCLVSTRM